VENEAVPTPKHHSIDQGVSQGAQYPGDLTTRLIGAADQDALLRLFEAISEEQGWHSDGQLRAYGEQSVYFGAYLNGELVGGLQLVRGNEDGLLPCRSVWPELDLAGRMDVADIALLALKAEHRGRRGLFWPLCVAMWRYCIAEGITEVWAEVPPRNLALYRRMGWSLEIAGPLRLHWGEECFPCRMIIRQVEAAIQAKATSSLHYRAILEIAYHPPLLPPLCYGGANKW
jgi:hypothetical protein